MHCYAVKPATPEYLAKAVAYRACVAANVDVPEELEKFFGYEEPSDLGMTISIRDHESCVEIDGDSTGFLVDVERLPLGTKWVRFECSW